MGGDTYLNSVYAGKVAMPASQQGCSPVLHMFDQLPQAFDPALLQAIRHFQ
jgi:hypothetical protein